MADVKKTFEEWEIETGIFALELDKFKKPGTMTKEQFAEIYTGRIHNDFTGVNYPDRVKFLKDNGYEVTRANLFDGELSAKPPKSKKSK